MRSLIAAATAAMLASAAPAVTFTATRDGDVIAYFAGSGAGYTETLGLEINGVATGVTGLDNQTSSVGQSLNLGTARAGDLLTFFINVRDTGNTFYSDVSRNADGFDHIRSSAVAADGVLPAGTAVGFEDQFGGGDNDYNDIRFVFTNAAAAVPETATWAMMIVGFGLIGAVSRRSRTSALVA